MIFLHVTNIKKNDNKPNTVALAVDPDSMPNQNGIDLIDGEYY
ncbi:hypothetical protein DESC_880038 [Desulfosarcina cetonica]|nr:hypothetical protein DESC_880038 [Desulfosarcina cetonica]